MSAQLKAAKDALVSSLYELSKAASDASAASVNFYNAALSSDQDAGKLYAELTDSLKLLTRSSQNVSLTSHMIAADSTLPLFDPATLAQLTPVNLSDHTEEPPKKKKPEKDPYAPKKPLTVFFAYSSYIREAIREERLAKGLPPLSSTEITQEISQKWNSMSEEEKHKWKEAYHKELVAYQNAKVKYLEDKKNGVAQTEEPTSAPVPLPDFLVQKSSKKRSADGEKEKKKKKKKDKKKHQSDASVTDISNAFV